MKSNRVKFSSVLIGAFLFNFLFRQEKMGIISSLYDLFLLAAIFSLYPEARPVSTVRWLLAGHLICLAMIKNRQRTIKQNRDMYITVRANYNWAIH